MVIYIRSSLQLVVSLLLLYVCPAASGGEPVDAEPVINRLYVDASAPSGGDGSTWQTAFHDLQEALLYAQSLGDGCELWVAEGVYKPDRGTKNRFIRFEIAEFDSFELLGGFPSGGSSLDQRSPKVFKTVLTGDLSDNDSVSFLTMEFDDELIPTNLEDAGVRFENREDNSIGVLLVKDISGGVLIDGVEIVGGHASDKIIRDGGGIHVVNTRVVLHDVRIYSNFAENQGGGIYVTGTDSVLEVSHSIVQFNSSFQAGGGIYTRCPEVQIVGTQVSSNSSGFGGGQSSSNGLVQVHHSQYINNAAKIEGAGFFGSDYGRVVAQDSDFSMNTSAGYGGGLMVRRPSMIQSCTFSSNVVAGRGGGLYYAVSSSLDTDGYDILSCVFRSNRSSNQGGGAYIYGEVAIRGSDFETNESLTDGGGLYITNGVQLQFCEFHSNHARGRGGGLNASTSSGVTQAYFTQNSAERGGAIAAAFNSDLSYLKVEQNFASLAGGGVYLLTDCSLSQSFLRQNSSEIHGGGLVISHDNAVYQVVLDANSAGTAGGGLYSYNTENNLEQLTCVHNVSEESGGVYGLYEISIRDSIIWSNYAQFGSLEEAQVGGERHDIAGTLVMGLDQYFGMGNIELDPLFVNEFGPDSIEGSGDEDLRLTSASPAIDAGSAFGVSSNRGPFDIDGRDRFVGFGGNQNRVIDMGAYEAQDCDQDAISDNQSIALGLVQDCNSDGVPDSCQLNSFQQVVHVPFASPDSNTATRFGVSLAIDQGVLGISDPWDSTLGTASGVVHLFEADTNQFIRTLSSPSVGASFKFGSALDMSGGLVVVGAPGDNTAGSGAGGVYVYDANTGDQLAHIIPDDIRLYDSFGYGVAVGEGYIAVGSEGGLPLNGGKIYVYDSSSFEELYQVDIEALKRDDRVGQVLKIHAGHLYIGYELDSREDFYAGSVLVYRLSDGAFVSRILSDYSTVLSRFGASVDLRNGKIAVGASGSNERGTDAGALHLIDIQTGEHEYRIIPEDVIFGDKFGSAVALGNGYVLSAAVEGEGGLGSVYMYDLGSGALISKFMNPFGSSNEGYGAALAVGADRVYVSTMSYRSGGDRVGDVFSVYPSSLDSNNDGVPDDCGCPADFDGNEVLNFFDVSLFIQLFQAGDLQADLNLDGQYNFFDISHFMADFIKGCTN